MSDDTRTPGTEDDDPEARGIAPPRRGADRQVMVGTFVIVGVAFAAVSTLASYVPAQRATRISLLVALRTD